MERDFLHKEIEHISQGSPRKFKIGSVVKSVSAAEGEFKSGNKILSLIGSINAKVKNIRNNRQRNRGNHENEFMPTSIPGMGYDFDILMDCMNDLERAAIKEGYSFDNRISAFRKIFYNSNGWNIVIPGAASVKIPVSWTSILHGKVKQVAALKSIKIQGYDTEISHLFAGLDAINHKVQPLTLKFKDIIPITKISSNDVQATYVGDLGSVVYEYQKARNKVSFRNMAMKKDLPLLKKLYTEKYVTDADMGGNADAYSLVLDKTLSIVQNLFEYYTAPPKSGVHLRYFNFANALLKSKSTKNIMTQLTDDIFVGSLAYAVGLKNDKSYVLLILKDPGPGIVTPTFWEAAYNATQWVLEEFLDRLSNELAKIKI